MVNEIYVIENLDLLKLKRNVGYLGIDNRLVHAFHYFLLYALFCKISDIARMNMLNKTVFET